MMSDTFDFEALSEEQDRALQKALPVLKALLSPNSNKKTFSLVNQLLDLRFSPETAGLTTDDFKEALKTHEEQTAHTLCPYERKIILKLRENHEKIPA